MRFIHAATDTESPPPQHGDTYRKCVCPNISDPRITGFGGKQRIRFDVSCSKQAPVLQDVLGELLKPWHDLQSLQHAETSHHPTARLLLPPPLIQQNFPSLSSFALTEFPFHLVNISRVFFPLLSLTGCLGVASCSWEHSFFPLWLTDPPPLRTAVPESRPSVCPAALLYCHQQCCLAGKAKKKSSPSTDSQCVLKADDQRWKLSTLERSPHLNLPPFTGMHPERGHDLQH